MSLDYLLAHLDQLPALMGEASIDTANQIAVGSGSLKKDDAKNIPKRLAGRHSARHGLRN